NIDDATWEFLQTKLEADRLRHHEILSTTHITGFRMTALEYNNVICSHLPQPNTEEIFSLISPSIDNLQDQKWLSSHADHLFPTRTNLVSDLQIQVGARVMFLNNSLFDSGLCNGTLGIVTATKSDNDDDENAHCAIHVAFPTKTQLVEVA